MYLASRVLNEGKPVTYRLLSRELKVHVNVAKQMLFDFHTKQNAKRPGSVNASYWVTGKKRPLPSQHTNGKISQDGGDSFMQSSPFPSSMPDREEEVVEKTRPVESHVIVREEELEDTLAALEELIAIHVYSLQPGPLENINLLSTCGYEIRERFGKEDSLETWKIYGTIHNPYIKRRTQRVQLVAPAAPPPAPKVASKLINTARPELKRSGSTQSLPRIDSEESKLEKPASQSRLSATTTKKAEPKVQKKGADFFKSSFAKQPPAKAKNPAPVEDEPMMDASEDEYEEDFVSELPESQEAKEKRERREAEKKAKQEKLDHIFDDVEDEQEQDVTMDDAPEQEESSDDAPIDKIDAPNPAEPAPEPSVTGGRKRGRRQVKKKKTVKDDEGYLVTKEVMEWESYSEDEPQPKKPKPPAIQPPAAKGKKGAQQGRSIASFFTKPPAAKK
ncbi:uncharacterized protein BDZ99DRAFT_464165 [Mytilinidion resinicola]|uniref:DNA polymerase delta subunit 3 n=1 Tax=Mytilinidion resinicola TaxID=574789 RepID=A0A6A6YK31_9PEZI|nr:uncharacterized protein BDZ99DRAFT_464165 [Mytilinidion resinicola]KAF2808277.1 hypothetical protein BDZ99DRAFT_464165 [Mytilinidion resinicola]